MGIFFGRYEHVLDVKNRLFMPSKFRETLDKEKGASFYITTGLSQCLYLFLPSQWEKLTENDMHSFSSPDKEKERAFKRFLFGNAQEVSLDRQGRILLWNEHIKYAGLKKNVTFVGVGNKAELWDTSVWNSYQANVLEPNKNKFGKIYDI